MYCITKEQFNEITNINSVWNQLDKTIPFADRQLGAFHIGDYRILPKFFFKANNISTYQVNNDIALSHIIQPKIFTKGINFNVAFEPRPEQKPVFDTILELYNKNGAVNGIIQAKPGVGKEQPYSEPILTLDCWTTMGQLKINDYVVGKNGSKTKVLEIHEQGIKDVYEITFQDGSVTRCGLDHLWKVNIIGTKKTEVLRLEEMLNYRKKNNFTKYGTYQKRFRYSIDLCEPINFSKKEFVIPPYSLGLLIGDGSLTLDSMISFSDQKGDNMKILEKELRSVFDDIKINLATRTQETSVDYNIRSKKLIIELKKLELHGKKSIHKHIPQTYLYSNVKDREQLLQGLIDTDSYKLDNKKSAQNSWQYYTSSKLLIKDFDNLTRSLGIYTNRICVKEEPKYKYKGEIRIGQPAYSVVINRQKTRKTITNIKLVGKEKSRCITVESSDSLYITRDYTVTHNTYMSIKLASILKYKTLCIVPNSILEDQWIDEITSFTGLKVEDVGVLQGSDLEKITNDGVLDKDIIVVKIQTLLSQLKRVDTQQLIEFYNKVGLVFYDECHQSGAAESYSKTSSIFSTDNIIGLSATPFLKGINEWLMTNSIGEVLVDLDHQNLIPTVTIHSVFTDFNEKDLARLRYSKGDYIKFLATHNMLLEQKEGYLIHLADWVDYRRSQGHIVAILFATNKMVYKMEYLLKQRGLNVGVITGSTSKKLEKIRQYVTIQSVHDFYDSYFKVFPKRKKCPEFKIFKDDIKFTFNKSIENDMIKINDHLESIDKERIVIHQTEVNTLTEREIMGSRDIIVSNFKMLTTGYSRSELSSVIIGTPLVGAIPSIQVTGRATRTDPNKNQDVQAQFFFTDLYFKMFPDMQFTLLNNLKKSYPTAKYKFEGFDFVKKTDNK